MTSKDKDSSFKSKDEYKSPRGNVEEIKPSIADLDLNNVGVRRKSPVVPIDKEKIKASRRGAETLDLKDIKEIQNTFTRRNLLETTKIHENKMHESRIEHSKIPEATKLHDMTTVLGQAGMSPINRKGRDTTKTSPGGNFAKIVMETAMKKPEESKIEIVKFLLSANYQNGEPHQKVALSMKSELRNLVFFYKIKFIFRTKWTRMLC
jgi:hypothetical protein